MNVILVILAIVLGFIVGSLVTTRRKARYFAVIEFWVYSPRTELPPQDQIMHRMLAGSPYGTPGNRPIGRAEGVLFSDIRTHIALVLKSKNRTAFRPDLVAADVIPTDSQLADLANCESMIKVRYASEEPLKDTRHVTFVTHAADAVAELTGSNLIYDTQSERLFTRDDLQRFLERDPSGTDPEWHLRVCWKRTPAGETAKTRGLEKVGLSNFSTSEMEADEKILVQTVLEEAAVKAWKTGLQDKELEVESFEDRFRVIILPGRTREKRVRILRVQEA